MLTLERSKKYHTLARELWKREELQRPARERVDSMGDRGLKEVLRYQREAQAILEANDWEMPVFARYEIERGTDMKVRKFYECGICDCIHPWDFDGDCREDDARLSLDDIGDNDELLSWQDRLAIRGRTEG